MVLDTNNIYTILKKKLADFQKAYIMISEILFEIEKSNADAPGFLQSPDGNHVFYKAIERLVKEGAISPVGKKAGYDGLHQKYRIEKPVKTKNINVLAEIIKIIPVTASSDYYVKNEHDFENDKEIIGTISRFLNQKKGEVITVNERAYELFGDEKFFKGADRSRGETVLKRLGLNYSDMGCTETLEPFFSFQKEGFSNRRGRQIYIIENKDTFWSFKRAVLDKSTRINADMVVYGEGRKILSSFRFMVEHGVDRQNDEIFYFGDLDPEGVNIFCELVAGYPDYNIVPFIEGYSIIFGIGTTKGLMKTPKRQSIKPDCIETFLAAFKPAQVSEIRKCLQGGLYVPQEALSLTKMNELFGVDGQ